MNILGVNIDYSKEDFENKALDEFLDWCCQGVER